VESFPLYERSASLREHRANSFAPEANRLLELDPMSAARPASVTNEGSPEPVADNRNALDAPHPVGEQVESTSEHPVSTFAEDQVVDDAAVEVESIAGAINELQARLEQANSRILEAKRVQSTEEEIGRLFVQAQQFTDTAINQLEEQARQAIDEAQAEADRIVAEAQHHAAELVKGQIRQVIEAAEEQAAAIIEDANRQAEEIMSEARAASPIPPETAEQLRATIEGFSRVNRELVEELAFLNVALAGESMPQIPGSNDVPAAVESGAGPQAVDAIESAQNPALPASSVLVSSDSESSDPASSDSDH
jgi:vacuolar-type H+-ATPase subunit H